MTSLPFFAESALDRRDDLRPRVKPDFSQASQDRFLLLHPEGLLHRGEEFWFNAEALSEAYRNCPSLFLGCKDGSHYFALILDEDSVQGNFEIIDGRSFAGRFLERPHFAGDVACALALRHWHLSHNFCPRCGTKTELREAGWRRDCPNCKAQHFPRTDPVVIMLVTKGDDCLLGRGHQFVHGRFSCLAGFVESGESIEAAARRELWEEAGIKGGKVSYLCSQPWPFPHNLMIGVEVEALTSEVNIDPKEIAEARWFSLEEVSLALRSPPQEDFSLPPAFAIASDLIRDWAKRKHS